MVAEVVIVVIGGGGGGGGEGGGERGEESGRGLRWGLEQKTFSIILGF